MNTHRKYGWRPDVPDQRDHSFRVSTPVPLPPVVDLRPGIVTVFDQGQLGSCTANALAAAFQFERKRQGEASWDPSRLFIYYNERAMEGTVESDSGACLRAGIKSLVRQGVCSEATWPYNIEAFTIRPTVAAYAEALQDQVLGYRRVSNMLVDMQTVLAMGLPFVVGISIYESFESPEVARSGDVPLPGPEERLLGGHAVLVVGYNDATRRFTLLNSWGAGWGDHGFFTLPYVYLAGDELAQDRWVISKTE